jgi:hypothetical protein
VHLIKGESLLDEHHALRDARLDLLADAAAITREEKAVGTLPDGLYQGELPGQDSNLEKQDQNLL